MDTMDFVKRAWAGLDLSSPFTPTLSLEELDKRIADLRAVEQWLALNQGMLRNTIQGLEIQRGTLAAVQNLSESFGRMTWPPGEETAEALARFAASTVQPSQAQPTPASPAPAPAAAAPPAAAPPAAAPPSAAPPSAPAGDSPGGQDSAVPPLPAWGSSMDPLAWWKVLQGNFEQIARMAGSPPGVDAGQGADPRGAGPKSASKRPRTAAKSATKARTTGQTGTKPAPRRKGRQAARGESGAAGGTADATSREEQ